MTGHEMTHVRKQHWAQASAKQQERGGALGLLLGIFHAGRAAQTIAGLADNALSLKYSRGEEAQADAGRTGQHGGGGVQPAGHDAAFPDAGAGQRQRRRLGGAFLSDHPLTSDRIRRAQSGSRS